VASSEFAAEQQILARALLVYKNFGSTFVTFAGPLKRREISKFIEAETKPNVLKLDLKAFQYIVDKHYSAVFFFYDDPKASSRQLKTFESFAMGH